MVALSRKPTGNFAQTQFGHVTDVAPLVVPLAFVERRYEMNRTCSAVVRIARPRVAQVVGFLDVIRLVLAARTAESILGFFRASRKRRGSVDVAEADLDHLGPCVGSELVARHQVADAQLVVVGSVLNID